MNKWVMYAIFLIVGVVFADQIKGLVGAKRGG